MSARIKHLEILLAESRMNHDIAIAVGIEIVKGRDARIAELEGQIATVKECTRYRHYPLTMGAIGDGKYFMASQVLAALQEPKP